MIIVAKQSNLNSVTLYLIKQKPFTEDFPAWPETMGVYNKYLPKLGYNIWWIAPSPEVQEPTIKKWENVNLYLIPYNGSSLILELISLIRFAIESFKFLSQQLKQKKNEKVILQVRDTIEGVVVAILLKKKYPTVPIVLNYSFLFYEGVADAFREKRVGILRFLYWWFFYKILLYRLIRHFDLILPISREMKIKFARELGISEDKQIPLPLGFDPDVFYPPSKEERKNLRKLLGFDENDVIIFYPGSISRSRRVSRFVKALTPVLKKYKNLKLVLVGRGDEVEEIKKHAEDNNIANKIVITGWLHKDDVPKYYKISDIGISLPKPAPQNLVMSPCKLFEYLGTGLAVIANPEIPEQKRVISGSKGGILITWELIPTSLSDIVEHLILSPKDRKKMGFFGHKHVLRNRSFRKHSERINCIYRQLLEKGEGI